MSGILSKLFKETAVYGLSSIVGRFLNWMLVPLYTRILVSTGEYGIVTNLYGWAALLMVLLTYGMETGFFRYASKEDDPMRVYATILLSLLTTSLGFVGLVGIFLTPIAGGLGYAESRELVMMLAVIIAMDAFTSLPFALLRFRQRPYRFMAIKMLFIALNIGLNLFFLILAPWLLRQGFDAVALVYNPGYEVGYIFVSNLIATSVCMLALVPELSGFRWQFDAALWRRVMRYSFPILLLGIAGIFNQTADKILFPFLFDDKAMAQEQLGIYGACFKVAIVMVMFVQAFRFAYEPFIFSQHKQGGDTRVYAEAMHGFWLVSLVVFLGVMYYLDILKYFIGESYYEGLAVVPIVMLGELCYGVYYNLSVWYKLTDQTRWGAYFSTLGCLVTVAIIIAFVPSYGYMACAWASLICNAVMMLASYLVGRRRFVVPYRIAAGVGYFVVMMALCQLGLRLPIANEWVLFGVRSLLLLLFVGAVAVIEVPAVRRLLRRS